MIRHIDLPYVVVRKDGYTTYHAAFEEADDKAKFYLSAFPFGEVKVFHAKLIQSMRNNIEPLVTEVAVD